MPNYKCEICGINIYYKDEYIFHLLDDHNIEDQSIKYYDCGCKESFRYIYDNKLNKHLEEQHKEKVQLTCKNNCGFIAKNYNQLHHHERSTCKLTAKVECKFKCGFKETMYNIRYHEDNKCHLRDKFKCICGFVTSKKYILQKHSKTCKC